MRNRQRQLSEWALAEEITKEFGNFFVGTFDTKQIHRVKKMDLDSIKKVFDTIKETIKIGKDVF